MSLLTTALAAVATAVALWPHAWPWRVAGGARTARMVEAPVPIGRRTPVPPTGGHRLHRSATATPPALPACVDMLAVALSAGAGLHEAVLAVGEFGGPGAPLSGAAARLRRGAPLLEVLDDLPAALGGHWQALTTTLALTATSGAPALPALRHLATAERTRERRRIERRIRRLPVVLLLPLVALVLPAFALLTLVPLLLALGPVLSR